MASKTNAEWLITYTKAGIEKTMTRWFDRAESPTENDAVWEVLKVIGSSVFMLPPEHRGVKYTLPQELAVRGAVVTSCVEAHAL